MANTFLHNLAYGNQTLRRAGSISAGLLLTLLLLPGIARAAFPGFANLTKEHENRLQGEALYQQAYTAYHNGDYPLALRLTEQADKLTPNQADGWNLRGVLLLKEKSYDQAEAAFTHALVCDPDLWAAQFNQAEVLYQRKDYPHAEGRFEKLLAQTNRFKDNRKWEIVLYKTFLSCLFAGDETGAKKRLVKLSAKPGTNPVLVYADAAVAFHRKDAAGAQKLLADAQGKFPQETNDLFSEPLVQAGWITVLPPSSVASGPNGFLPTSGSGAPALGAATGVASTSGGVYNNHQPVAIDPKMEAAAAEPLPVQEGSVRPMLTRVSGVRGPTTPAATPTVAPINPPTNGPAVAVARPPRDPQPDPALDHGGLLLE